MSGRMKLRLPSLCVPGLCNVAAGAALLAALLVGYLEAQTTATRLLALRAPQPPAVAIEAFDAEADTGLAGEVTLRAQIDPAQAPAADPEDGTGRLLPLLPVAATGPGSPAVGLLRLPSDRLPPAVDQGAIGPVIEINGTVDPAAALPAGLAPQLAAAGHPLAVSALTVTPFAGGRAAALSAPRDSGIPKLLVALAGALLVAGLVLRRRQVRLEDERRAAARAAVRRQVIDPPRDPATDKARHRFAPLAQQEELLPPPPAPAPRQRPLQRLAATAAGLGSALWPCQASRRQARRENP